MAYCVNCGEKIQNEELICVTCGTNMEKIIRSSDIISQKGSYSVVVKRLIDNIKKIFFGMLKSPVASVSQFANELGIRWALLIGVLTAALFGVLGIWAYEAVYSGILKFGDKMMQVNINTGRNTNGLDQVLKQNQENFKALQMSQVKVFTIAAVAFLLSLAIAYIVFYLITKYVFKQNAKPAVLLSVVVCSSIPFLASLYVQMILSYLAFSISLIAPVIGFVVSLVCLYNGVKEGTALSANQTAILLPCAYIAMGIILYSYLGRLISGYFTDVNIKRFMVMIMNYLSGGGLYYY